MRRSALMFALCIGASVVSVQVNALSPPTDRPLDRRSALAAKAAAPRFLLEWGKKGSEPGEFNFPIGIAINAADEVFVTDFYNARVQKFSLDGRLLALIPVLPNPGGIAVSHSGDIYLAHFADRMSVYDASGKLLRQWGRKGTGNGEFDYPGGLAIGQDGRVYVADQTNRRVQVFDGEGKFVSKWGEHGTRPGQFGGNNSIRSRVGGPQFLAFDRKGNLYTTEGSVGRVQKFTPEGQFMLAWGDNEVKPGSFGGAFSGFKDRKATLQGPIAICVDKYDRVWVSAVCGRIQQFTDRGAYVGGFGSAGTEPGQFYAPHGLAFDSRGHLYVVDAFNHRVQKFAVGDESKAPPSKSIAERNAKKIPTKVTGTYSGGELVELRVRDRMAYLIKPTGKVDPQKRWLWDFPFWLAINDGFGNVAHRYYVEKALAAGIFVAGVDVGPSCGSPAAAEICQEFYQQLVLKQGFNKRARVLAHSHGGLIAFGWAFRHPACVDRIAGMCPATDFRTYPTLPNVVAGPTKGLDYGLSLAELSRRAGEFNPVDNLAPLCKAGVKILHLHGEKDTLVPTTANSLELARRYRALGGEAEIILLKDLGATRANSRGHDGPELYESARLLKFLLAD